MAIARQRLGTPRVRGHRYVGGRLGQQDRERHYIAGIIAAVAAIASAVTTYAASESAASAADYNRKVAKNQADAAREAGVVAEQNEREQDRRILAAQRARAAASGLDPNQGASLLAEMESASTAE